MEFLFSEGLAKLRFYLLAVPGAGGGFRRLTWESGAVGTVSSSSLVHALAYQAVSIR